MQFGVELGGLGDQKSDPGGDGSQCRDSDSVLDGGAGGAGEMVDSVELLDQREPTQSCSQMVRGDHDQALEFVDRFGAADQNTLSSD